MVCTPEGLSFALSPKLTNGLCTNVIVTAAVQLNGKHFLSQKTISKGWFFCISFNFDDPKFRKKEGM